MSKAKMFKIQCSKEIHHKVRGHYRCSREAVAKWKDKWYCWQHDPFRIEQCVRNLVHSLLPGKARRFRITDFDVTTYENLLIYTEALEKTVKKTVKVLFDVLSGLYNGAAYDAGFPDELCETMRKMAEGDPEDLSHVKDYVRRMTE